jgi:glutathione S-transferase
MSEQFNRVAPAPQRSGWGDFDLMIRTLEDGIRGREWILGDQFTAADVMLGSSAVFLRAFDMLPDSELLADYADRCLARPAYARVMEMQST